jgi:hypothetical protein
VMVWSGIVSMLPWLLLKDVVLLGGWMFPHRLSAGIFLACGMCWVGVNALWQPGFAAAFEGVLCFSRSMLGIAALCGVLTAGQLAWYFRDARALGSAHGLHTQERELASGLHTPRPRVIWIILDELSYQQVYERRFPGLRLPVFDEMAHTATVFTSVTPAAAYTEAAVPSMMTGLRADRIRAGGDGSLQLLHDPVSGRWQPFHAQDTVFRDALSHGFRTGVAGWFNPYCRILSDVLDRCQWVFRANYGGSMLADASTSSNVYAAWRWLFAHVGRLLTASSDTTQAVADASDHLADYLDIVAAGDGLLGDSSIDFVLLHIPVPHPGGIYDRRTGSFTTHTASYVDNLALADRYLGHVRQVLEQRGEWDSSAVVVMGDHSWRTKLVWVGSPQWTAEDEAASHGGQFDDRPGYIVKLPYQAEGARIDSRFAASRTRALLDGILDGGIRSEAELARFAGTGGETEVVSTRAEGGGSSSRDR